MLADRDMIDGISVAEIKQNFPIYHINNGAATAYINFETGIAYMADDNGELTGKRGKIKPEVLQNLQASGTKKTVAASVAPAPMQQNVPAATAAHQTEELPAYTAMSSASEVSSVPATMDWRELKKQQKEAEKQARMAAIATRKANISTKGIAGKRKAKESVRDEEYARQKSAFSSSGYLFGMVAVLLLCVAYVFLRMVVTKGLI